MKEVPRPGDITMCLYCGHPMVFTDDMGVRSILDEDYDLSNLKEILVFMRKNWESYVARANERFVMEWVDSGREPQVAPNPDFPYGVDVDISEKKHKRVCVVFPPYPAPRCGVYMVKCLTCKMSVAITTAGRPDDPRRVVLPCMGRA